jgi:hypothetical protein
LLCRALCCTRCHADASSSVFLRAARYGAAGAARVAALAAAQQARYERVLQSAGKLLVWPCEPLRSVP